MRILASLTISCLLAMPAIPQRATFVAQNVASSSFATYTDNFTRANGSLGANWTTPSSNSTALTIVSDQVEAAITPPGLHNAEGYTAGTFSNNQWTKNTINNNGGTTALQSNFVRVNTGAGTFYNDAVGPGVTSYQIGIETSTDFCGVAATWGTVAVGDTFELDVADTGVLNAPEFFWLHWTHSGVTKNVASCVDTATHHLNGVPGLGTVETGSTPNAFLGTWSGGSLPALSGSGYVDNFTRANSYWLGVNWWPLETGGSGTSMTGQMQITSNAAVLNATSTFGGEVWTTPYASQTQNCTVTFGVIQASDFAGCIVRYSMPTMGVGNATTNSFYLAWIEGNGATTLYEYQNGSFNSLSSLGTCGGGSITSLKLSASGSSPVALSVFINGTQCGSTFNDSTYKLSGTYGGIFLNGSNTTTITNANLN